MERQRKKKKKRLEEEKILEEKFRLDNEEFEQQKNQLINISNIF